MQTRAPRHGCGLFLSLFFATSIGLSAQTPNDGYPPTVTLEEVRASLDLARSPHPRLLTSQAGLQAVRQSRNEDPLRRQLAATVIGQADLLLDLPPITRTLEGS